MGAALQKTKLFLPTPPARLVERPRLLERLDGLGAPGCRVGLISAPAGSGKTTLATQWLAHLGWPVGWLSLDARDNQPARFFAYLIAALQQIVPGAGEPALALLGLPGSAADEIVALLANDLVEAPRPFVLALDDLHTLTEPRLLQALDLLIDAQPPQMRLLLLSRDDPAVRLAGRRARGQLVELRQDALRFTPDEAVAFLNRSMGLRLSVDQAARLEARTEGWIAGLQMAALSLQNAADTESFLRAFSGSHRFILDYLVEEVLAHQPAEVQTFLQQTAVLERLCAGLCAAVTAQTAPQAQRLLEQLARANLFVIPLDDARCWYRYHHLFRDLLLARLQSETLGSVAALELRASQWFEANGEPRLAVEYALKAKDFARAADLVECHISERWQTVDMEFHLLINHLPFDSIVGRPALCLQSAWLCVMLGQAGRILPFVDAAEQTLADPARPPAPGDAAHRAFARTLRVYVDDLANRPVVLDDALALAPQAIPEGNTGMRNSVDVVIGTIYYMEGEFAAALRYFEDARQRDQRVNGTNAVPITAQRIALVRLAQGQLHEAESSLRQADAYIQTRGSRQFYINGVINLMLAAVLLEWGRLDEAGQQIHTGLRRLEDWPMPQVHGLGQALLARQCAALGDLDGSRAALARADALQQVPFHAMFADAIEQARLSLLLALDDRPGLESWARKTEQALQPLLPAQHWHFRYEARLLALCRAWLALDRPAQALDLLERLAVAAASRPGSLVAIRALQAAAHWLDASPGYQARALAALDQALRLGRPENYRCTFLELGRPLHAALSAWLQQPAGAPPDPALRAYARDLWAGFGSTALVQSAGAALTAAQAAPAALVEPLSPRELEVLRLVALGLTNPQIGERLFISVRTVKKHLENIHGKLGAQNRTQAVARARELGLLA
ncbi:MAG: LuxR C-terminal-related transcriptional regulator [Chloroflexota bacterium]